MVDTRSGKSTNNKAIKVTKPANKKKQTDINKNQKDILELTEDTIKPNQELHPQIKSI